VLDVSIGNDDVGVGAALSEALAEAHAAVGQFAFEPVDIDQGTHHLRLCGRVDDGQQGVLRPEGIPDAIKPGSLSVFSP
jgi:hypothetical protein